MKINRKTKLTCPVMRQLGFYNSHIVNFGDGWSIEIIPGEAAWLRGNTFAGYVAERNIVPPRTVGDLIDLCAALGHRMELPK